MREAPAATRGTLDWTLRPASDVAHVLGVDPATGLDVAEAARRRSASRPNVIAEANRRGPLSILVGQFRDRMALVLIAAAVVAGVVGEPQDTVAIVAIVILNAALGFVQEFRAERALVALRALAAPQARVRRGGRSIVVPADDLVPGDVVLLEAGNVVPADLRLAEAVQLRVDEALLTGESRPVEKVVGTLPAPAPSLAERANMVWKGTVVAYGRGTGLVVATGMVTELGRIARLLGEEDEVRTPLQRRLDAFARRIAGVVAGLCGVIFLLGLLAGEPRGLMFMTALSLAVAAVPEALPAVVTVALALGARRLAAERALIRRLPAVETLGSVTCICSDKTGTLTANRNQVWEVRVGGDRVEALEALADRELLLAALALSNDVDWLPEGGAEGDPTEVALACAAAAAGAPVDELVARWPRVAELPFSSERSRMTTLHRAGDGVIAFVKGSPETVLARCARERVAGVERRLDAGAAAADATAMAQAGLRVLALAYRRLPGMPDPLDAGLIETDLTLLALVGLIDPPRPEVPAAVALCRTAGIRVLMITGDHPATAGAIARMLGIGDAEGRVLTGPELAALAGDGVEDAVARTSVYARVAPEQKIAIVKALQARGEAVAMTGDGVNDAPALRRADIGVAMGLSGSDVAREASHMVLLDDDFSTIVAAVREGRRIDDDIRKFIKYVLTGNSGEIWTLFLAPLLGLPVPLLPIHILWVNLVTDGLPGLALAVDPAERGVMHRPPRPPDESVFAHGLWQHVLWVGLLIAALTLAVQTLGIRGGSSAWRTMTVTVLTFSQLFHVLAIRLERDSVLARGVTSNPALLAAVGATMALHLMIVYVPAVQPIFKTQALRPSELALCLGLAAIVFVVVEIDKAVRRRRVPA